ncbi:MAG TPA: hypothetical protein VF184_03785 [Phycisphaeraceae bacterium]
MMQRPPHDTPRRLQHWRLVRDAWTRWRSPNQPDQTQPGDGWASRGLFAAPWLASVTFHATLVLLAATLVWSTASRLRQTVVPVVQLGEPAAFPLEVHTSPLTPPDEPLRTSEPAPLEAPTATPAVNPSPADPTADPLIGVQGASPAATPFATPVGRSARYPTQFFGVRGNARRVVFLVDASGSLVDTFPYVLRELGQTIAQLSQRQHFTVIFFRGDNASSEPLLEPPPAGLKPATAAVKRDVLAWLDPAAPRVEPAGRTDPLPALERALSYQPQLIFLLSDNITGPYATPASQQALIQAIERLNRIGAAINTIQFLYPDPMVYRGGQPTLKLISEKFGGVYRFISAAELGIQAPPATEPSDSDSP